MNKDGERSVRLQLGPLSESGESAQSLGAGWLRVQSQAVGLAALAVQYLKHKRRPPRRANDCRRGHRGLVAQGAPRKQSPRDRSAGTSNRTSSIECSYGTIPDFARDVAVAFPTFAEFCADHRAGAEPSGMVWERIAAIEPVDDYDGQVYDFTVDHPDHNFIANGFVVSNCGVRLVRSNLFYRDVKPHLRTLVDELFRNVPTGVGRSGRYQFDRKELKHLLGEGPRYLQGRGLATQGDIDHTEARRPARRRRPRRRSAITP